MLGQHAAYQAVNETVSVSGKQELNQSWSRELFKFVFSILLKSFSFEKNEDIEK